MKMPDKRQFPKYLRLISEAGLFSRLSIIEHSSNAVISFVFTALLFSRMSLIEIGVFGFVLIFTALADTLIRQFIFISNQNLNSPGNLLSPGKIKYLFYSKCPFLILFFLTFEIILGKVFQTNFEISWTYIIYTASALVSSNLRYTLIYAQRQRTSGIINFCLITIVLSIFISYVVLSVDFTVSTVLFIWIIYLFFYSIAAIFSLHAMKVERTKWRADNFTNVVSLVLLEAIFFQLISVGFVYVITVYNPLLSGVFRLSSLIYVALPQMFFMATSPRVNLLYANGQISEKTKFYGVVLQSILILPFGMIVYALLRLFQNSWNHDVTKINSLAIGVIFQTMALVILACLTNFTVASIGLTGYLRARIFSTIIVYGLGLSGILLFNQQIFNLFSFVGLLFTFFFVRRSLLR